MNDNLRTLIRWLVILAMPFFLGFTTITQVIRNGDRYLNYQYFDPGFPADPLGLTPQERFDLATVAVGYLNRPEPAEEIIHLLESQTLPDSGAPLYIEREIGHMIDVKHVTDAVRRIAWIAGVFVVGGLALLWARPATRRDGHRALRGGGLFTTVVLAGIGAFIVLAWNIFFVQFHELLFPPDSWTFAFTDGLIRLFPEKFWQDIGVLMSGSTFIEGLLVTAVGHLLLRRAPRPQPRVVPGVAD